MPAKIIADKHLLIYLHAAALYAPDGYSSHILIIINGAYQHLKLSLGIAIGRVDMLDYLVKQRLEVLTHIIGIVRGQAESARAEHNGAVYLFLGGV